jgi:hypothetical protein
MDRLFNYKVEAYSIDGHVLFSRNGRFFSDEDALNHFYDRFYGFNELSNTVNLAFTLSGGASRVFHTPPKEEVALIKLFNNDIGKITSIST